MPETPETLDPNPDESRDPAQASRPPNGSTDNKNGAMRAIRQLALFVGGTVIGLYSIATGSLFGWITGLVLIGASFFLVRRWWLPRSRGRRPGQ